MRSRGHAYESAVELLNSTQSNASILQAVRASGGKLNEKSIPEMRDYMMRLGYSLADLDELNIIHIAGTKGKGSTSAFCESILRHCKVVDPERNTRPLRTGLYTSPHILEVRERIRLDGVPLTKEKFVKYFHEVWNSYDVTQDQASKGTLPKPPYFRFLTALAYHVFVNEGVDVAIMETGMGGVYDATNVIHRPVVCGISSLGFDHMAVLGKTLSEIAWHKAGIMKAGVPCYSSPQREDAMKMIQEQALTLKASKLLVARPSAVDGLKLGLAGNHQKLNASLAVYLCATWIHTMKATKRLYFEEASLPPSIETLSPSKLPPAFVEGLARTTWLGRAQIYKACHLYPNVTWYLDGAHTPESILAGSEWFESVLNAENNETIRTVLIFNCNSTHGRDGSELLKPIFDLHHRFNNLFQRIIFTPNEPYRPNTKHVADYTNKMVEADAALTAQYALQIAWKLCSMSGDACESYVVSSIEEAIELAVSDSKDSMSNGVVGSDERVRVFVTGSLYLVGGVLTNLKAEVA
ncbi:tetrahydrofolate synthase [Synchytrium endobioticum]|uniref:Folylpolyglutamate synthase n=1 Tax=Synchytrium endobioticum TaxID=286115 RepID=A0A507D3A2_9FUNG|nr:tetrahydrofolate synthase [Synchytrium endobioticum]TPX52611.1 tetrahydrofolate synthase [Synchytrium endobioticum]